MTCLLGGSRCMDSGHQAFQDAKILMHHLQPGQQSEPQACATARQLERPRGNTPVNAASFSGSQGILRCEAFS